MTNRSPISQIMTILLFLVIGPSYLVGGANVSISYLMIAIAIYSLIKGQGQRLDFAEKYFGILCFSYYLYFAWRVLATGVDERAARFFQENIIFLMMPLLLMVSNKFDVNWIIKRSADWLLPSAILLFLIAYFEYYYIGMGLGRRVEFLARSPLILAVLIVSGVYISLADWFGRGWRWRLGAAVSWVLALYVILIWSQSRMALMMYFAALGIFITFLLCSVQYTWRKNLIRLATIIALFAAVVVVAVDVIMHYGTFARFQPPISAILSGDLSKLDLSSTWRLQAWGLAWGRVGDHLWVGFGPQNTFVAITYGWPYTKVLGHLHSDFFNHLIGGGLIGLGLFFGLLFSPIVALISYRAWNDQTIYICALSFSLVLLAGLTARVFFRPVMIEWFAFTYFFCLLVCKRNQTEIAPKGN